jgi:membrane-associated phospholipid phosphatase
MRVSVAAGIAASVLLASPVLAQTLPTAPVAQTLTQEAPPTNPVLPSFGSLFRDLGNDFRRLPSRETALTLGVAGGISVALQHQDARLTRQISRSLPLDTVFEPGDVAGSGAVQTGAAFATFAIGRIAKSPRMATAGADLVRGQILNTVLTQSIKISVRRTRPDGNRFSFPSGHASSAFATAAVLQRHFGWKAGVPAYGLAAFIGASRMQENKHYLSDIVFGAAVGIASGRTVTIGRGKRRFAVAPFAAREGAGVGFGWVGLR